jgi:cell division control protein 6
MTSRHDVLDDVFNNFLDGPKIFQNREVLRPDYIPSYLPHREKHIRQIGSILAPVLRRFRGSNIFIYGQTGTGKTAVVKYVLDRLNRKSSETGIALKVCYINCRLVGTDYRILSNLCTSIGTQVPFTGLATSEVFTRFNTNLDGCNTFMIAVLDEIDALVKKHGDTLLYDLTRINEMLHQSKISLIGISNDLQFKELLDPRVLSSLSEEEVVFEPYSAPELTNILLERAKISFVNNVLTEGALKLTAALAAAEHGDARRALDLLRVSGELAERSGVSSIGETHVRKAQKKIEHDRVYTFLRTLPFHSKIILCSLYFLKKTNVKNAITGDVYEIYQNLCSELGLEALTQRRISSLISELDLNGILNSSVVSRGRYGRTKKIRLGIPLSIVRDVFSEDPWTKNLIHDLPKKPKIA